jgi:transglutaminase-like putative cysteine protease
MLYNVRLTLTYDYHAPVLGGRHHIRVLPSSISGIQTVETASLYFTPQPVSWSLFGDFFGNVVYDIAFAEPHRQLDISLDARISVDELLFPTDVSGTIAQLGEELSRTWTVRNDSPHHFLAGSPRIRIDADITDYARTVTTGAQSVYAIALALCTAINRDFAYDPHATDVETATEDAFAMRRGVCQDFAHVMITALRGMGIPAGYVSGFLRTIPPPGQPRLEGADAMHAWVRVWCGSAMGWVEFDPTNAILAGNGHIRIGHGRDYSDVSPIVGVLRTHGSHETRQSVDVIAVE